MVNVKLQFLIAILLYSCSCFSQSNYTISKVHSHNDYWQKRPFWLAYEHGLGSIEADTYLSNGKILVGHDLKDLNDSFQLENKYLIPLQGQIAKHPPFPYADSNKDLQLLIEMKSDANTEIFPLIAELKKFPAILFNKHTPIVITGNIPSDSLVANLPSYIQFDGQIRYEYSAEKLKHIAMLSDDLHYFVKWNGTTAISDQEFNILSELVKKVHKLGKKVRFWNAPDNENAWITFEKLNVDYINTDHIEAVSSFFNQTN